MKKLISWLLPKAGCVLCRNLISTDFLVCAACYAELPWKNAAQALIPDFAGFNITRSLFHYQPPIDDWISQLKFQNQLIYARFFSQCLITQLKQHPKPLPTHLLPVPLHRKRLRERGFNQALEIAKPIAQYFKIPLATNFCQRLKYTKPQTDLSAKQRAHNVKNAFALKKVLPATHIAIIDDVVTTGSTVAALTQLLKNNGVSDIEVWCVARPEI